MSDSTEKAIWPDVSWDCEPDPFDYENSTPEERAEEELRKLDAARRQVSRDHHSIVKTEDTMAFEDTLAYRSVFSGAEPDGVITPVEVVNGRIVLAHCAVDTLKLQLRIDDTNWHAEEMKQVPNMIKEMDRGSLGKTHLGDCMVLTCTRLEFDKHVAYTIERMQAGGQLTEEGDAEREAMSFEHPEYLEWDGEITQWDKLGLLLFDPTVQAPTLIFGAHYRLAQRCQTQLWYEAPHDGTDPLSGGVDRMEVWNGLKQWPVTFLEEDRVKRELIYARRSWGAIILERPEDLDTNISLMTIDAGHPRREAPMNMGTGGLPIGIGYDDPAPAARMNRFKRMYTMACEEHEAYGKWMASRGLTVEGYRVEIDDGTSAEE